MTKDVPSRNRRDSSELTEALAVLISCTHSKKRPVPLTDVAIWLEVAIRYLGSYSAVADRIGLSPQMLRQFRQVLRLAKPVQKMFKSRSLDSVDAAVHLAMLPKSDQESVATALASGQIDTGDLRAFVELRRNVRKPTSIASLLKRVTDSKARKQYVAEFVVRGRRDPRKIRSAFSRFLREDDIVALDVTGSMGRIVLTQNGKRALGHAAKAIGVPLRHVIPSILQGANQP